MEAKALGVARRKRSPYCSIHGGYEYALVASKLPEQMAVFGTGIFKVQCTKEVESQEYWQLMYRDSPNRMFHGPYTLGFVIRLSSVIWGLPLQLVSGLVADPNAYTKPIEQSDSPGRSSCLVSPIQESWLMGLY